MLGYDLITRFFNTDICQTDAQDIAEVSKITEDLTAMGSYVSGFNVKFEPEKPTEHISSADFYKKAAEEMAAKKIQVWGELQLPSVDQIWNLVKNYQLPDLQQIWKFITSLGLF